MKIAYKKRYINAFFFSIIYVFFLLIISFIVLFLNLENLIDVVLRVLAVFLAISSIIRMFLIIRSNIKNKLITILLSLIIIIISSIMFFNPQKTIYLTLSILLIIFSFLIILSSTPRRIAFFYEWKNISIAILIFLFSYIKVINILRYIFVGFLFLFTIYKLISSIVFFHKNRSKDMIINAKYKVIKEERTIIKENSTN